MTQLPQTTPVQRPPTFEEARRDVMGLFEAVSSRKYSVAKGIELLLGAIEELEGEAVQCVYAITLDAFLEWQDEGFPRSFMSAVSGRELYG